MQSHPRPSREIAEAIMDRATAAGQTLDEHLAAPKLPQLTRLIVPVNSQTVSMTGVVWFALEHLP